MTQDLKITFGADASDVLKAVNDIEKYLVKLEKSTENAAAGFEKMTKAGDKNSYTIQKQVDKYTTLTKTIRPVEKEIDGMIQVVNEETIAIKENQVARKKDIELKKKQATENRRLGQAARRFREEREGINKEQLSNIRYTELEDKATKKLVKTYVGINKEGRQVTQTLTYMGDKLVGATRKEKELAKQTKASTKELNKQKKATTGLSLSLKGALQLVSVQLARRAVSYMLREIFEAIEASAELYKRIGEIQTISQEVPLAFEKWKNQLREISDLTGFDALDTAEAAYQTLSNQVAKGAEVFRFQAESAKFARVTNSSLADSVNLLSSALNSYSQDASEADVISAKLFKTIELGRVRASEIANTVGRVTVVASQLGISLDEVNALLALTTNKGLKARQAMTQVRGVMNGLLKPTKAMSEFFGSLGFNSAEAAIEVLGFEGVLKEMAKTTKGQATELVKLIPRVRGLSAALVAINKDGDEYQNVLKKMATSQEDYRQAVDIVTNNTGVKFEKYMNRVENAFLDFGGVLQESIVWWADFFTGGESALERITKANEKELRAFKDNLRERFEAYNKLEDDKTEKIIQETIKRNKKLDESSKENIASLEEIATKTKNIFADATKEITESVKEYSDNIKEVEKGLKDLETFTKSFDASISSSIFDERLKRANPNQQLSLIKEELKRAEKIRIKAIREGDAEVAKQQLEKQKELVAKQIELDGKRVEAVKNIDEKIQEQKEKIREASTEKELKKEKELLDELIEERKGYVDSTTGYYYDNYEKLYTELITLAKTQEQEIKKIELKRIEELKQKELEAAIQVLAFKLKLKQIEEITTDETISLAGMSEEERNKALEKRAKIYKEANDIAQNLGNTEQRNNLTATLKEKERLELVQLEIALNKKLQEQRLQSISKNKEERQDILNAIKAQKVEVKNTILDIKKQAALAIDALENNIISRGSLDSFEYSKSYTKTMKEIFNFLDTVKNQGGFPTVEEEFKNIHKILKTLKTLRRRESANLLVAPEASAALTELLTNMVQAKEKIKELTGQELTALGNQEQLEKSIKQLQEAKNKDAEKELTLAQRLNKVLKERNELLTAPKKVTIPRPEVQTKAKGGIAYGQDSVNALLTPGEFVMNASSSRRFYSQLVGMNSSNNSIQSYNKGGSVSVGDVNINMTSSGNENYDIQALGKKLQRAIRRKTISLN